MNTESLSALLRLRYQQNGWALVENVRDATGTQGQRYADAMAFGLYPSRGLEIIGLELKVSRSDWLRELKSPEKAEAVCRYCDKWYIVAGDKDIVKDGELPPTWGLMVPYGQVLRVTKEATTPLSPVSIDRLLLASLVRSFCKNYMLKSELMPELDRRTQGHVESRTWKLNCELGEVETEKRMLEGQLAAFAKKTGIDIRTDSFDDNLYVIGDAVKAVMHMKKCIPVLQRELADAKEAMRKTEMAICLLEPLLQDLEKNRLEKNEIIGP